MTKVIIELELKKSEDVTEADVINYLYQLIQDDCLRYEVQAARIAYCPSIGDSNE